MTDVMGLSTHQTNLSPGILSGSCTNAPWLARNCWASSVPEESMLPTPDSLALPYSSIINTEFDMTEGNHSSFEDLVCLQPSPEVAAIGDTTLSTSSLEEPHQTPQDNRRGRLSEAECDLRLSQLSMDLGGQMQQCMTAYRRRNSGNTVLKASENPFEAKCKGPSGDRNSNAFGNALRSTSDFLNILESFGSRDAEPGFDHPNASVNPGDPSQSSLGLICVLSLLSSYLRIVAIFDSLFFHLYELLCCDATRSLETFAGADLQPLPGLQLAGFTVQQGSFQTKILIQAIQHQFQIIEKMLGLPLQLRVSDRKDVYPGGILGDEGTRELFDAMLRRSRGGRNASSPLAEVDSAAGSLGSLRRNIMRVRQLVDT